MKKLILLLNYSLIIFFIVIQSYFCKSEIPVTPTTTSTIQYSPYGEFCIDNSTIDMPYECLLRQDKWGGAGCTDFKQCIFKQNENNNDIYGLYWNLTRIGCKPKNYVLGYPHILFGMNPWSNEINTTPKKLPDKLKNISTLNVSYSASIEAIPNNIFNKYNFVFDCWLTDKKNCNCSNIKYEIMIYEKWNGIFLDFFNLLNWYSCEEINGELYDIYIFDREETETCTYGYLKWKFIIFLPKIQQQILNRNINLLPFFQKLIEKKLVSYNDYLTNISLGNEIFNPPEYDNNRYICTTKVSYFIPSIYGHGNAPPNMPTNPSPSNGAINQEKDLTLNWLCSDPDPGDVLKYDVYFDINNPPNTIVSQNQSTTSFSVTNLNYNKTYYWKIVAKDKHDAQTHGPVWNFTTKSIQMFYDDFSNSNLNNNWILSGSPSPQWIANAFSKSGLFDNNGDGWYNSEAYSKTMIGNTNGFTIETEIYVNVTNIAGCWNTVAFGLTKNSNPQPNPSNSDIEKSVDLQLTYEGDACWGTPSQYRRHYWFWMGLQAEDNTWNSPDQWSLNADNYGNGWHTLKIVIGSDRYVKFYVDNSLLWTSTKRINTTYMTNKNIILGNRSSGSAGKCYHDWIKVYN